MLQYLYTGDYTLAINGTTFQHEKIKNSTDDLRNGFRGPTSGGFSSPWGMEQLNKY
jgi:hypothetical protein